MHIKTVTALAQVLQLSGFPLSKWTQGGRDNVARLFTQMSEGDAELMLVRKVRRVRLYITYTPKRKKKKGAEVMFLEQKFAPDGTLLPEGPFVPGEKLRPNEEPYDGLCRLLHEEFGITAPPERAFLFVKKVRVKRDTTPSFPDLPSETTEYVYAWNMPRRLFRKRFVEKKPDGGWNEFTLHEPSPKVREDLLACRKR